MSAKSPMAWTSTEHPPAAAAEVQAACARRLPQRAGGHAPGLVFPSVPGPRPVHHGARRRELVTAEPNSSADQNSPCPPLLGGLPKRDPPHYAPRGCRRHPGGRLRGAPPHYAPRKRTPAPTGPSPWGLLQRVLGERRAELNCAPEPPRPLPPYAPPRCTRHPRDRLRGDLLIPSLAR